MKEADEAIDEIRAVRHRISAEHGHDIHKYIAGLREQEKQYQDQIIHYHRLEPQFQEGGSVLKDKPAR